MGAGALAVLRDRRAQVETAHHPKPTPHQRIGGTLGGATRLVRQLVQIAMLAAGAWLVIGQDVTPGVMIAATIILGRALAPIETLVAGWRGLVEARAAWRC